jgi:hypothetical protein
MTTTTRLAMAAVMAMTMVACGGQSQPVVTSLEVLPRTMSLDEGASAPVTVIATYDDGSTADVTGEVAWETANSVVARAVQGIVHANAAGATDLTARWNGHAATAQVEVAPILTTLFGLAQSPTDPAALVMVGLFSDGSMKPVALAITWTSSNPGVLAITEDGALQAVAPGQAWVRVTVSGMLFSIGVRVNADLSISIGV